LHALIAYPVAGHQVNFATFLVYLAGLVSFHDVLVASEPFLPILGRRGWLRPAVLGSLGLVLLGRVWVLASSQAEYYNGCMPLGLPGAGRLRLPEDRVALYRWLCFNLRAYADSFATMPGFNSLYLWTEQEPPTTQNTNAWMGLLNATRQREIVDALAQHPRACAVRNNNWVSFWLNGQSPGDLPLVHFLIGDFRTVGRYRGYEFQVRKNRPDPDLLYCVRRATSADPTMGRVNLPPMEGYILSRMALAELTTGSILADTQGSTSAGRLSVFPGGQGVREIDLAASPIAMATAQQLRLRIQLNQPPPYRSIPVLRLYDGDGVLFATLPFTN
jgi:hypothetical protein